MKYAKLRNTQHLCAVTHLNHNNRKLLQNPLEFRNLTFERNRTEERVCWCVEREGGCHDYYSRYNKNRFTLEEKRTPETEAVHTRTCFNWVRSIRFPWKRSPVRTDRRSNGLSHHEESMTYHFII